MPKMLKIKNLNGINWDGDHRIPEEGISMLDFIKSGEIEVGDVVKVEHSEECKLPLQEGYYCLTFDKAFEEGSCFFTEEPFSKAECKILFCEEFDY